MATPKKRIKRVAKVTVTSIVHRDAAVMINDSNGRPCIRTRFLKGKEYRLPQWWYEPLREQGALTPKGGEAPPSWAELGLPEPETMPDAVPLETPAEE